MTALSLLSPLDRAILAGAAARLSLTEIAEQQKTSPGTVSRSVVRLRALGHDVRLPIATAHPVTRGLLDAVLVVFEAAGLSCQEMSQRLGCTAVTVVKRLRLIRLAQGLPARKVDARTVRYSLAAVPLDLLTPRQQQAWEAAATHETMHEAADAAGMSRGALRTHLCNARRRIAEASGAGPADALDRRASERRGQS